MKTKINGKTETFTEDRIRLTDYLAAKGIRPETVAVEINMNIVDKSRYSETYIQDGDEVEIVKFVGGG